MQLPQSDIPATSVMNRVFTDTVAKSSCRHVASYRDLTHREKEAMNVMQEYVMKKIDERFHPDCYNVGINIGESADQSVFYCHMHVIPRYMGDVPNPKGGVRGVIQSKQKY